MSEEQQAGIITLTEAAAQQIQVAAQQSDELGDMARLGLRIVPEKDQDGSIQYRMGFDESSIEDLRIRTSGVLILISPADEGLLKGTVMDYVELEPGDFRFIFLNPNDPDYTPPADNA